MQSKRIMPLINSVKTSLLTFSRMQYNVRITQYGWNGEFPIPDHLQASSWMDGAHAQLQLIMSEENLEKEKDLKISSNKQSAARTVVKQAADTCPCFKLVKKMSKLCRCRIKV